MPRRLAPARLVVVPVVVLAALVLAGWTARPRVSLSVSTGGVDARLVYLRDCAGCHGADAKGTSKAPTLEGWGRAGVDYALTTGRMPLP